MGLDMYACITKAPIADVDFANPADAEEIAYWRKHPNLHGWMENLYCRKGGAKRFNCTTVRLDATDLDALERVIAANRLPYTTGFFFGESQGDEAANDLAFIAKARKAIAADYSVFYDSWW